MEALLVTRRGRPTTWLGRARTPTDYARTEHALQLKFERVATIRYDDDDTVIVRHLTGDFLTGSAVLYEEALLPAGTTDEEVAAWATARLT